MSPPTFSIVTPSLNQGAFIEETIKSVLRQAGDFYIDYIVMDGGSTDDSIEIIKKYDRLIKEGKWPVGCKGIQYRWASEKDKGQTDAINKGLNRSRGDIVAYLNSDDIYLEGVMKRAAEYFSENEEVDVIYGDCRVIDDEGRTTCVWRSREFDLIDELCMNFIYQPTVFMRCSVLDRVGYFDTGLRYCMDIDYWYRVSMRGKLAYIPVEMAAFRISGDSKTGASRAPFLREWRDILEKFFDQHAKDVIRKQRKHVFSWHHFNAARDFYLMKDLSAARKEFLRGMRLKPFSLKACLSLAAIIDTYAHTSLFAKASTMLQLLNRLRQGTRSHA
jgi:glycosyltransferase involved in cell wall biosynthesis